MTTTLRVLVAIATGLLSALVGLLFAIAGGVVAWTVFRGIPGVLLAMVVGGLTAFAIRRFASLPASTIAGAIGAAVAAFLAIACGEVVSPGSVEWAVKGGLYGAMVGGPIGAVLGPLALGRPDEKSERFER
jgi:peptidoglycan/LPS O-acetylase OafA/YrhL